jgi:hypothetical protein
MNAPVALQRMPSRPRRALRCQSIAELCDAAVAAWGVIKAISDAAPHGFAEETAYLAETEAQRLAWYNRLSRVVDHLAKRTIQTEEDARTVARAALALTDLAYVDRWGIVECMPTDRADRLYLRVAQFVTL